VREKEFSDVHGSIRLDRVTIEVEVLKEFAFLQRFCK
jgi:hypothetical protein